MTEWPRKGQIEISNAGIQIDAAIIADAFALDPTAVQSLMRDRKITAKYERGQDEDAGRFRVTFSYEDRALRLTFDEAGTVLSRSRFPLQRKPVPQSE